MPASHSMPNEREHELLSAYLDGELSDQDRAALERRLAQDSTLRADLEALRSTVRLLRGLPTLKAPRNFTLDPAVYSRRSVGWQRWLAPAGLLQLSGALGAAASVVLIVVALTLHSGDGSRRAVQDKDAASSVAWQATSLPPTPTVPATALEEQGTAIAYGGEGLFQATLAMQSTLYADTSSADTPSAQAFAAAVPAAVADSAAATGTPAPEVEALEAAPAQDAAIEPYPAAQAEQPLAGAVTGGVAPAPDVNAPPQPYDEAGQAAPAASAPPDIVLREAAETTVTATPPAQPTETATPPPTPSPAAVANTVQNESGSSATDAVKPKAAPQPTTQRPWWLAGVGACTLVLSGALLLVGRRKAHRS